MDTRLIPAHAGKTLVEGAGFEGQGAHPRSRGENTHARRTRRLLHGSSPLTRGKHGPQGLLLGQRRLIPAHAGKTIISGALSIVQGAHPRSRGENNSGPTRKSARMGSSPLTRGKRHMGVVIDTGLGLIPAHAGKTAVLGAHTLSARAHPRSRGEN